MALLNHREREELLGGLRGVPLRFLPALATTALLVLSGDLAGLWALSWVALVPLCFACRGAGAPGALLLSVVSLGLAGFLQSFWLLDVEGVNPALVWLWVGILPALAFAAIELPTCRSVPWPLRPLLLAALATGCWYLLPHDARFLIPFGGLIDSELVRFAYPDLGLAVMAGLFTGIAWLSAEMFYNPRQRERTGWPGIAMVVVLLVAVGADWLGSSVKPQPVGVKDITRIHIVPGDSDLVGRTESLAPPGDSALAIWNLEVDNAEQQIDWVARAGEFSLRRQANLILLLHGGHDVRAYFYVGSARPVTQHVWRDGDTEALVIEGSNGALLEGVGRLRVFPGLDSPEHWASMWDLELYLAVAEPAHPAQARYWLREQRRGALVRGSRQVSVWKGRAVAIDGIGRVIASSDGEAVTALLPAGEERGQPLGRARLTVIERILAMGAPMFMAMLLLLTPVRWAKWRYRARRQAGLTIAIEEVADDETTLSKEQTETITRRLEK
ncbi:MAG: hypothetical protein K8I27_02715 [Planctomycetes bacterium]|nr:hypothetical protein [Planctomycetota bacterium]